MPDFWLHNRKRPAGEAGRFWGYYREERYVSLYMWIRGRWVSPVYVMGAVVGSNGAMYDAGLDLKVWCCSLCRHLHLNP